MHKLLAVTVTGFLALGASLAAAQNGSPASLDHRDYAVAGFDKVGTVGPNRVVVAVGPAPSVRAEGPAETLDRYEVVVTDGSLSIRPKQDNWRRPEPWRLTPATFYVSLPRLEGASVAGSGTMQVDRIAGERFAASVAGSGALAVAALQVDDAELSVAGSGDLVVRGSARRTHASVAGSGELRAQDMRSGDAWVSVVGSGDASLNVSGDAHVSVMGSGDVKIAGTDRCFVSRWGSGKVRCS